MKIKLVGALLLLGFIVSFLKPAPAVKAQGETPHIVDATTPISSTLRSQLDAWLAVSAPRPVPYYAVTNVSLHGTQTFVSLVALGSYDPAIQWSIEDGNVAWIGSVRVLEDGTVIRFSVDQHVNVADKFKLSMPVRPAPGGGPYVGLPWKPGTMAYMGSCGVHGYKSCTSRTVPGDGYGDYGTVGMRAVDWVSTSQVLGGAAPDEVYTSDTGVVDYVCDDGISVAVRTYNPYTGDYFLYAHMLNNANLVEDHIFNRLDVMGKLKHGPFSSNGCGYADQDEYSWHVHWMFTPADGFFQAWGCLLNISTEKWDCGGRIVGIGNWVAWDGSSGGAVAPVFPTPGAGTPTSTAMPYSTPFPTPRISNPPDLSTPLPAGSVTCAYDTDGAIMGCTGGVSGGEIPPGVPTTVPTAMPGCTFDGGGVLISCDAHSDGGPSGTCTFEPDGTLISCEAHSDGGPACYYDSTGAFVCQGHSDGGQITNDASFFDLILVGILEIFDKGILKLLPVHTAPSGFLVPLWNTVLVVFRIAQILFVGNINLGPAMALIAIGLGFRLALGLIWFFGIFLQLVRTVAQIIK